MTSERNQKRQKLEKEDNCDKEWNDPQYGSQGYWEDRYKQQINGTNKDTDAFHAWYFNYQELSPLILPIILGDEDYDGSEEPQGVGSTSNANEDNQELETDDDSSSDDEDSVVQRQGLCSRGPVDIIEIGCGDMPLGADLALDLLAMEDNQILQLSKVVKSIVCTDYSSTVVQQMQDKFSRNSSSSALKQDSVDIRHAPLKFAEADACSMPYSDESFDLILEKGTLDAMISDKRHGRQRVTDCIAECGRILRAGGFMLLISHLNACTSDGMEWLENVVFPGLSKTQGNYCIEVHTSEDAMESETPGPAVYVILKSTETSQQKTIPVKICTH